VKSSSIATLDPHPPIVSNRQLIASSQLPTRQLILFSKPSAEESILLLPALK
jgi:hypothetical protein